MNCNGCKWKGNEKVCEACNPTKITNLERSVSHGSLAKKESKRLDTQYNIHVHSRTNRLSDPDGRSIKALLDSIVNAGILQDDSAKFVKEVTQSQEKVKGPEETIIIIEEIISLIDHH